MTCGWEAEDCVLSHWCEKVPDIRREPAGWRAPCPGCGKPRCLSVQVKGRYPVWNLHCQPRCDRNEVRRKLAEMLPGCVSARYSPKHAVNRDELVAIALDKSLPPNALRVAILQELGLSTPEIKTKLRLPKQSWSDVVRILGQNRRSA